MLFDAFGVSLRFFWLYDNRPRINKPINKRRKMR